MDERTELQLLILLDGEVVAEVRAELDMPAAGAPVDQAIYDTVLARQLDALAAITRPLAEEHGVQARTVWPPQDS